MFPLLGHTTTWYEGEQSKRRGREEVMIRKKKTFPRLIQVLWTSLKEQSLRYNF